MSEARSVKVVSDNTKSRVARTRRRRKKNFADGTYGARLTPEDARIADDYSRQHKLKRSDVVRLAMHQFALRQQMRYKPKDPAREALEELLKAHLAPLSAQLQEGTAALAELMPIFAGLPTRVASGDSQTSGARPSNEELSAQIEPYLREQKQLLERVLVASTLALRLHVNYLVEPQLRLLDARDERAMEPHLRAADNGRESWSSATREVMSHTGNQILRELEFVPPKTPTSRQSDLPQGGSEGSASTLTTAEIVAAM